jgi:hypothetical protein
MPHSAGCGVEVLWTFYWDLPDGYSMTFSGVAINVRAIISKHSGEWTFFWLTDNYRHSICTLSPAGLVALRQTFVHRCQNHGLCDRLGFGSGVGNSRTGHLNRGFDGIFEIVRVVGRGLVSIAEVHAIGARAHLAQSEPRGGARSI